VGVVDRVRVIEFEKEEDRDSREDVGDQHQPRGGCAEQRPDATPRQFERLKQFGFAESNAVRTHSSHAPTSGKSRDLRENKSEQSSAECLPKQERERPLQTHNEEGFEGEQHTEQQADQVASGGF
jgi:hypothetical protein